MVLSGADPCRAQSNDPLQSAGNGQKFEHFERPKAPPCATNWGKSIAGVRLSMTITESAFESGSSVTVLCVISNASTNVIYLGVTGLPQDYDLVLENRTGMAYHLITPTGAEKNIVISLPPGEVDIRNLDVKLWNEIEPGDYTLTATRLFSAGQNKWLKVDSNPLKIEIRAKAAGRVLRK